jgi:hypothetical protein
MNAFKLLNRIPERVQVDREGKWRRDTECQVTSVTAYWHPTGEHIDSLADIAPHRARADGEAGGQPRAAVTVAQVGQHQ